MAKSTVVTNAKEFARWADKTAKAEAIGVMTAMSKVIDAGRMAAAANVIPSNISGRVILWRKGRANAYGRSSNGRLIRASKLQPVTAGKVTERTGLLIKTLSQKGRWTITANRAKFEAPHWGINIRPQLSGRTLSFIGNVRLHTNGPVKDMAGRLMQEKSKGRPFLQPGLKSAFNQRIAPELVSSISSRIRARQST